jgi:hypothetical protein
VIFQGSGENSTVISVETDTVGIQTDVAAQGWIIRDLAVQVGSSATGNYTSDAIVVGNNCWAFEIANVTVTRPASYKWNDALTMTNAWTGTVRRFRANTVSTQYSLNTAGWAIHYDQCDFAILGGTAAAYVTGNANTFTACKFQGEPIGLYLKDCQGNTITSPWFEQDYAVANVWCVTLDSADENVFIGGSYTASTRLSGGYLRLINNCNYNKWLHPRFTEATDASSVSLEDTSLWNSFIGGNVAWATVITQEDTQVNHYSCESFNTTEQIARFDYGDGTGEWHFGHQTAGIRLEQGVSAVSGADVSGLFATIGGGSAPFDAAGNLIIKPRNQASRSVEIWAGATPKVMVKTDDTGIELGADGVTQGALTLWDGAGGNTPGWFSICAAGGARWYFFVTTAGQLRFHNAPPTADSDGTAV